MLFSVLLFSFFFSFFMNHFLLNFLLSLCQKSAIIENDLKICVTCHIFSTKSNWNQIKYFSEKMFFFWKGIHLFHYFVPSYAIFCVFWLKNYNLLSLNAVQMNFYFSNNWNCGNSSQNMYFLIILSYYVSGHGQCYCMSWKMCRSFVICKI